MPRLIARGRNAATQRAKAGDCAAIAWPPNAMLAIAPVSRARRFNCDAWRTGIRGMRHTSAWPHTYKPLPWNLPHVPHLFVGGFAFVAAMRPPLLRLVVVGGRFRRFFLLNFFFRLGFRLFLWLFFHLRRWRCRRSGGRD